MQSDLDEDFDGWVMLNRERLYKRAYVICGSWHQADDLVQEALIKVYPKWLAVTNKGDPMPYVRRVLVRACIDQGRRPWRREDPVGQLPEQVDPVVADVDFEPLLAALRRMPARQRAVLVLRYWDQLTVKGNGRCDRHQRRERQGPVEPGRPCTPRSAGHHSGVEPMNDLDLRTAFEDLTRFSTPSRYEPGSVQVAARRRRRRNGLLLTAACLASALAGTGVLLAVQLSSDRHSISEPSVVPWRALTPGPKPSADLRTPLAGEPVSVGLDLPEYRAGESRYRFVVRLSNTGSEPVSLDPCPFYRVTFQREIETGYLNCEEAPGSIPARGYVDLEMTVPAWPILNGPYELSWELGAEGAEGASARGSVAVAERTLTGAIDCGAALARDLARYGQSSAISCMKRAFDARQAAQLRVDGETVEGGLVRTTYDLHANRHVSLVIDSSRDPLRGSGPAIQHRPCANPSWLPEASCPGAFRATADNAPCERLEFAGQTYVPASEQNGIGIGGGLTGAGEPAPATQAHTARARGLNCVIGGGVGMPATEPEMQVEVYSAMEQSPKQAVTVSGLAFGREAVWEYVSEGSSD